VRYLVSLVLAWSATMASAADPPYTSGGFLKFPDSVQLDAMSAVAIDAKDNIYALHRGQPPLVAFDAQGEFVRAWGKGLFKVPHGLRVDRDGNVWTTDNGNHVLRKFSPAGELLVTLGTPDKPGGGKDGFRAPDDLVFDSAGNIYVADSGNARIVKLSSEGKYLAQWGSKGKGAGQFATAHGLAIDAQDRIYVADRGNKRVQVFSNDGNHVANWSGFGNPFGLLVIGDKLLASEGDIHQIFHLDREGKIVGSWGDPELLKLPHLMAVDSQGVLYVSEVNGKRVQKFKPNK
jgi:DNA-binding beta-propeller fold protein YncE